MATNLKSVTCYELGEVEFKREVFYSVWLQPVYSDAGPDPRVVGEKYIVEIENPENMDTGEMIQAIREAEGFNRFDEVEFLNI